MNVKAALRNTDFKNLWLGQAISQMGDSFYSIVFLFMVQKVTKNPALTGFVAAMEWIPFLLLGPYAGVVADRLDRRRIMLWSDWLSAIVLLSFAAITWTLGKPPILGLFLTPLLLSTVRVFFSPAKTAAIPRLVSERELQGANSLSMATQSAMPLIALPLSATVLAALYARSAEAFLVSAVTLNALSFIGSALFITKLPPIAPLERPEERHAFHEVVDGVKYIRGRPELAVIVLTSLAINLFISPFYIVYIATNERWFGGKPQTFAFMEFCFFIGMTLGGLACSRAKITFPGRANSLWMGIVGVTVAAMGFATNFPLYCFWNLAAGIAIPFSNIPVQTFVQATTEDGFRGRVNSALNIVSAGVHPIGMAASGILIQDIGLIGCYLIMGGGMILAAGAAILHRGYRSATFPKPAT